MPEELEADVERDALARVVVEQAAQAAQGVAKEKDGEKRRARDEEHLRAQGMISSTIHLTMSGSASARTLERNNVAR